MPNFDGAGPRGQGSQSGRSRGRCEGGVPVECKGQGMGGGFRQRQRRRDVARCVLIGNRQRRHGFLYACLESLQANIQDLQEQLGRLQNDLRR